MMMVLVMMVMAVMVVTMVMLDMKMRFDRYRDTIHMGDRHWHFLFHWFAFLPGHLDKREVDFNIYFSLSQVFLYIFLSYTSRKQGDTNFTQEQRTEQSKKQFTSLQSSSVPAHTLSPFSLVVHKVVQCCFVTFAQSYTLG